jgi:hypothetical protein
MCVDHGSARQARAWPSRTSNDERYKAEEKQVWTSIHALPHFLVGSIVFINSD